MIVREFDFALNKWILISQTTVSPYGYIDVVYY